MTHRGSARARDESTFAHPGSPVAGSPGQSPVRGTPSTAREIAGDPRELARDPRGTPSTARTRPTPGYCAPTIQSRKNTPEYKAQEEAHRTAGALTLTRTLNLTRARTANADTVLTPYSRKRALTRTRTLNLTRAREPAPESPNRKRKHKPNADSVLPLCRRRRSVQPTVQPAAAVDAAGARGRCRDTRRATLAGAAGCARRAQSRLYVRPRRLRPWASAQARG